MDEKNLESSILLSIKKMLGLTSEYNVFDQDIIIYINSTLSTLTQLGVRSEEGFRISGEEETWDIYLGDSQDLENVKTYIYLKVRLLFDPPTSSFVLDSFNNQIKELEWRINVQVDRGGVECV